MKWNFTNLALCIGIIVVVAAMNHSPLRLLAQMIYGGFLGYGVAGIFPPLVKKSPFERDLP